jgi:predicted phage terminase large subunit-like protein
VKLPAINKDELEASICRDSLYDFVQRFWSTVCSEQPVWNWHIKVLCDMLQEGAERVFRGEPRAFDYVINIPPGTTKSLVASVMFPAWTWARMPSAKHICVSYSYNLAQDLSLKCRDIVESEKFNRLFGKLQLREDQNTKGYYKNTAGGYRLAVGTGGSTTGFHGHFLIIDDPLNPEDACSAAELIMANRFISETLSTRKVDKAVTLTLLIMQRLHQNDPSANFLERARKAKSPVRHVCLPGEILASGFDEVRPRKLRKMYKDGLLDPVRLSRSVLSQLRGELLEYGYAGQILQRPIPRGGGMFKIGRIQTDTPPAEKEFAMLTRYWDKAATGGGGAFTVGTLMGRDKKGAYWVLDVVRGQWDSSERENIIHSTAQIDGRKVIVGLEQEPGSGGKESAEQTAKRLAGYRVKIYRPVGDKIMRADPFSVQVNAGNVRIKEADWNREWLSEFEHFPHSKFKDQVDSGSGAFSVLTKPVVRVGGIRGLHGAGHSLGMKEPKNRSRG